MGMGPGAPCFPSAGSPGGWQQGLSHCGGCGAAVPFSPTPKPGATGGLGARVLL